MSIDLQQRVKLGQQLLITPQLQQAIKILQLSSFELEAFIDDQLNQNPILEETEPTEIETDDLSHKSQKKSDDSYLSSLKTERKGSLKSQTGSSEEKLYNYEETISEQMTLRSHMREQLNLYKLSSRNRNLCDLLIDTINDSGYLVLDNEFLTAKGFSLEETETMIKLIQSFEPNGIGARNLSECLLIQAKLLSLDAPQLETMIKHHLDDLARKKYKTLSKKLNITLTQVTNNLKLILSLNAQPGRKFSSEKFTYIKPDIYVIKTSCGWSFSLEKLRNENLAVGSYYQTLLPTIKKTKDKDYIKGKVQEAKWLIKSLEQRNKTLIKVMKAILVKQEDFFLQGKEFLKPLVLKDIAKATDLHESTISRITSNKYVHTDQGLFELRSFFNSGLKHSKGEPISSSVAKHYIRQLIKEEDRKKPLSDRILQAKLQEKGIDIARRTVTKYREQLGFLPSSHRVRYH